jgi:hypothetical protein
MNSAIGVLKTNEYIVFVRGRDGVLREVLNGDDLFLGDIIESSDVKFQVELTNGRVLRFDNQSGIVLDSKTVELDSSFMVEKDQKDTPLANNFKKTVFQDEFEFNIKTQEENSAIESTQNNITQHIDVTLESELKPKTISIIGEDIFFPHEILVNEKIQDNVEVDISNRQLDKQVVEDIKTDIKNEEVVDVTQTEVKTENIIETTKPIEELDTTTISNDIYSFDDKETTNSFTIEDTTLIVSKDIDFTNIDEIGNKKIDTIKIDGENIKVTIDISSIIELTNETNRLTIFGDESDNVVIDSGGGECKNTTPSQMSYTDSEKIYSCSNVILEVGNEIDVDIV